MLWESHPWKVDLMRRATWLRKRGKRRWWLLERAEWSESECAKAEQCIMVACYCVRKLKEARKLTDDAAAQTIPIATFKPTDKTVHSMNWHRVDELFDLQEATADIQRFDFVCNQLIHSFVFALGFSDSGGLNHFLFCSDRERHRTLFRASVADFAKALEIVANDDVRQVSMTKRGRDYDRTQS